ncbi:MAG: DUF2339 domain-containing protein [Treponema sp.]|nr:DUF2339 domain-containing protein [Treponema sp.]
MTAVFLVLFLVAGALLFAVIGVAVLLGKTGEAESRINGLERRIHALEQRGNFPEKKPSPEKTAVSVPAAGAVTGPAAFAAETPRPLSAAAEAPLDAVPLDAAGLFAAGGGVLMEAGAEPLVTEEAEPSPVTEEEAAVTESPATEAAVADSEASTEAAETGGGWGSGLWDQAAAFVRGGNLWAAGGVLLLIAGFATLITWLARRGFFTVEMGIAAAALSGIAMLAAGWRFRKRRPVYFLLLQGGGIGILYLSVYAAHRLTPYFPAAASLVIMSVLVPSVVVMALFQDAGKTRGSQVLAIFGFLGGFAAPLLLSFGTESRVFLFSYYLVLDAGVFVIAFFRRWKGLNLLAFFFTFAVSLYWTARYYEPAFFPSSEPFFAAYILLFTFLCVKDAGDPSPKNLENPENKARPGAYSDGTLIVLTPVMGAFLEWMVFSRVEHGYAIICFSFSVFYTGFALLIWKLRRLRFHAEGFLFLAALLANLAVPLELSPRITSAVWAAEGAAFFFLGRRLNRFRPAAAGLLLHIAAAVIFAFGKAGGGEGAFRGARFSGALVISFAAFLFTVIAGGSRKKRDGTDSFAEFFYPAFPFVMAVWAFAWWFGGWYFELKRTFLFSPALFLVFCSATAAASCAAARVCKLRALLPGALPSLVYGFYIAAAGMADGLFDAAGGRLLSVNFFYGLYRLGWPVFFAGQALVLFLARKMLKEALHGAWLTAAILIAIAVTSSSGRSLTAALSLSESWTSFAGLLPVFAVMAAAGVFARRAPDGSRNRWLFFILPLVLSCVMALWFIVTLFLSGDPDPLPLYLPVVNPLDLEEAFCLVLFLLWQISLMKRKGKVPGKEGGEKAGIRGLKTAALVTIADSAFFVFTIAVTARSVHFYGGIPWEEIPSSYVFHLCLFILWAIYGIAHIITGNRLGGRRIWIAGAVLTVADVAKFLLFDLAGTGAGRRIASFFIAGIVLLFIGWASPLPPAPPETEKGKGHA